MTSKQRHEAEGTVQIYGEELSSKYGACVRNGKEARVPQVEG